MLLWQAKKTHVLPGDLVKHYPNVAQSSYGILKGTVCVSAEMQNFFVSLVKFVKKKCPSHNKEEKIIYIFK